MVVIKDSMVLIHLAKITLLRKSCELFKSVLIPRRIYEEILKGEEKGYGEVILIKELIEENAISIIKIENSNLLKKANEFNIQRGEAEAVALYWQESADFLASDDNNVRKKSHLLNLKVIGTPVIILNLFRKKIIDEDKTILSIEKLKEIGWFSDFVLDKILMEVKNG